MANISTTVSAHDSPHLSLKNLGTGNVMFQIASVYGFSRKFGMTAEFSSITRFCDKIKSLFNYDHKQRLYRNVFCKDNVTYQRILYETVSKTNDEQLLHHVEMYKNNNILIHGYLEHPQYFHEYRNDILELFKPDDSTHNYILEMYPEITDPTKSIVSLHIRQGADANTRCDWKYYERAIQYMIENEPNSFFYIFSDRDVDPSRLLNIPHRIVKNPADYVDIWTMSMCKHNITTYSTFSWWGAYLNTNPSKIVTYPRSALLYIQSTNGVDENKLHNEYFLTAKQINDLE